MSSPGSERIPLRDGADAGAVAALSLALPEGAARAPDEALPAVDLSNLPGGRLAARRGWQAGPVALRVVCVAAPAGGWAPGVEEIVLGRATQLAGQALGADAHLTTSEPQVVEQGFAQRFGGGVVREGVSYAVEGRHWLGFAGDPREAILCTTVCTEAVPEGAARGHGCEPLVAAAVPVGGWVGAPPPNLALRALLLAAERPPAAAGVLLIVALGIATLVVARRPRPRPG